MKFLITYLFLLFCLSFQAQTSFRDSSLPIEERVDLLISQMTIDEKISQLMSDAPAIKSLGIPKYDWWNESLHGVARAGYATVFPQSISIAASWDKNLLHEVATAISDEARAKHHEYARRGQHDIYQGLTMWSPNINIFRDPRWGRGHETYGEDPYLTGQLGLNFVKGLQGDHSKYLKTVATAKHFAVHSGPEASRHTFDVYPSERDLWETYLPAFRTLVKDAQVSSIMTAYNRFRGEAASASDRLYNILRNDWGFNGYVVSDCGAISDIWEHHKITSKPSAAAALALEKGCDLNCGGTYSHLKQALQENLITENDINIALKRLLHARFKFGMFDEVSQVSYAQIPFSVNTNPSHRSLARKAAQKSIVLLKNENKLLPLNKNKINSIAVIGPNANNKQSLWGNYNGTPKNPVTVFEGIKNKVSPFIKVKYEEGAPLANGIETLEVIPSVYFETEEGKQGLNAFYYDNLNWQGDPLFQQIDDQINFEWDINTPDPRLELSNYSVKWKGFLKVPESGTYYFSDWSKPYMTFSIAEEIEGGGKHKHHPKTDLKKIFLEEGKRYAIEVNYKNYYGNAIAKMQWATPKKNQLTKAIQLTKESDLTVLVLGLNERLEGEEMSINVEGFSRGDRTSLQLPNSQVELMKAVVNTGKPVVLVLLNGSALAINWASENIPSILTAGYPGEEGGNAIADVLFGDYNPAGRLPVTYYKSVDQLPDFENYDMAGRTYRYFQGDALYPFGYGLSYTSFEYSNLQLSSSFKMNESIDVSVEVKNTGEMAGDEVVQLYIKDVKGSTPRPLVELKGFERIHLHKGEQKSVHFTIFPWQLAMINSNEELVIEPGNFIVYVGGRQPDSSKENKGLLKKTIQLNGKVTAVKK
ncbi:glycoside hydrolase family 3 C-terminal domain-containing protein [Mesonia mobilis]|uniref:glycoside hydrolase family 3 C-terminal domain-containing protein n=1 Tax=Mesonia mobilis TaxID=369791 RepID=UPI0024BA6EE2|nr:glycoside hydrolase family 3 C-terminal domain-containing protein [Mesonia mobilis]